MLIYAPINPMNVFELPAIYRCDVCVCVCVTIATTCRYGSHPDETLLAYIRWLQNVCVRSILVVSDIFTSQKCHQNFRFATSYTLVSDLLYGIGTLHAVRAALVPNRRKHLNMIYKSSVKTCHHLSIFGFEDMKHRAVSHRGGSLLACYRLCRKFRQSLLASAYVFQAKIYDKHCADFENGMLSNLQLCYLFSNMPLSNIHIENTPGTEICGDLCEINQKYLFGRNNIRRERVSLRVY